MHSNVIPIIRPLVTWHIVNKEKLPCASEAEQKRWKGNQWIYVYRINFRSDLSIRTRSEFHVRILQSVSRFQSNSRISPTTNPRSGKIILNSTGQNLYSELLYPAKGLAHWSHHHPGKLPVPSTEEGHPQNNSQITIWQLLKFIAILVRETDVNW